MTARRAAAAEALLHLEDHGTTPFEVVVAAAERIEAATEQGALMTAAQAGPSLLQKLYDARRTCSSTRYPGRVASSVRLDCVGMCMERPSHFGSCGKRSSL